LANINAGPFTTRPEIDGTFGVAASTHWIATAVAMGVLERGGNAFDAGLAGVFTLQVVEPHLNGPGGDVPVILYDRKVGKPQVVCGQGPAPAGASIAHYRDELGLDMVPGSGLLAACVPGTFPTYMRILRDHGTWRLRDVLAAAIGYADNGFALVERACVTIGTVERLFRDHWPTSAQVYLPGGRVPRPGALFSNRRLAQTYQRLIAEAEAGGGNREAEIARAERAWSQGFVAEAIDRFCRTQEVFDVTQRRHKGVLTGEDMATWQPTVEAPVALAFGDYEVLKSGPWTQGPVLLQQLALLKQFDLAALAPSDPDFVHVWTECAKLAYADREAFYADPDVTPVPMQTLLSDAYNAERARLVDLTAASLDLQPGHIDGFGGPLQVGQASDVAAAASGFGVGEPTVGRLGTANGDTVHIDIIDKDGNMFAATPSGGWLQSSPVIPELGFPLTRADVLAQRSRAGRPGTRKTAPFDLIGLDGIA